MNNPTETKPKYTNYAIYAFITVIVGVMGTCIGVQNYYNGKIASAVESTKTRYEDKIGNQETNYEQDKRDFEKELAELNAELSKQAEKIMEYESETPHRLKRDLIGTLREVYSQQNTQKVSEKAQEAMMEKEELVEKYRHVQQVAKKEAGRADSLAAMLDKVQINYDRMSLGVEYFSKGSAAELVYRAPIAFFGRNKNKKEEAIMFFRKALVHGVAEASQRLDGLGATSNEFVSRR